VLEAPAKGQVIIGSDVGQASAAQSELRTDAKTPLPWLVVETRGGGPSAPATVHAARPFLTLARAVLWNAAEGRHVAEFLFGLDPEVGEAGPLDHPMEARFAVTCDEVLPAQLRVEQVGPAGYSTVKVKCSPSVKNDRPQQELEVLVERGRLSYPFRIPRRPGALSLVASSPSVLGFGFGTTVLTVERLEEDGSPLPAEEDLPVQLLSSRSGLPAGSSTIPRGHSGTSIELHPSGIGRIEVSAAVGALRSPAVALRRSWPFYPIAAMLLGGALGGALSLFGKKRRRPVLRVLQGIAAGVAVTAVVLVVPSFTTVPGWARGTELGLFVVATCAGYLGTQLVDGAARLLFPAAATAPAPDQAKDR
jgi:hypothetical protein